MLQVLRYGRGHMAVDCKLVNLKKLQKFGFGIPGQGFYSLNIPEARARRPQLQACSPYLKVKLLRKEWIKS